MKNAILFLALLTLTSFVYGQRSPFDLSFQAGSSFRTFDTDNILIDQVEATREMNFILELGYNYKINYQWVVKTGANYSTYSYSDFNGTTDNSFVGIPLLLRYQLCNCTLSPYVEAGPSVMFLTDSKYSDAASAPDDFRDKFNAVNVFGRATVGVNYTLSSRAQMFGGVTYNKQLNNFRADNPATTERLNSFGVQLGMRAKFGGQRRCCVPQSCCPQKPEPSCCPGKSEKTCGEKPE